MKYGPAELVKAIQPIADMLNQLTDLNSKVHQFLAVNTKHTAFLQELTKKMHIALRFKQYGHYKDSNGKSKDLFGEYLDAIYELNHGKAKRLTDLFKAPVAQELVKVFDKNLADLTDLNKEFLAFKNITAKPVIKLDDSFDEIENRDLMSQSSILGFDHKSNVVDHLSRLDDLIDLKSGKRIIDLPLDQSIIVAPEKSTLVAAEDDDFGFTHINAEDTKALAFTPGYKAVGKYGQSVNVNDLSQSMRWIPVTKAEESHKENVDQGSSYSIFSSVKSYLGY